MSVWIVVLSDVENWDIIKVFDSEAKAKAFVDLCTLNNDIPGAYYDFFKEEVY